MVAQCSWASLCSREGFPSVACLTIPDFPCWMAVCGKVFNPEQGHHVHPGDWLVLTKNSNHEFNRFQHYILNIFNLDLVAMVLPSYPKLQMYGRTKSGCLEVLSGSSCHLINSSNPSRRQMEMMERLERLLCWSTTSWRATSVWPVSMCSACTATWPLYCGYCVVFWLLKIIEVGLPHFTSHFLCYPSWNMGYMGDHHHHQASKSSETCLSGQSKWQPAFQEQLLHGCKFPLGKVCTTQSISILGRKPYPVPIHPHTQIIIEILILLILLIFWYYDIIR